MSSRMRVRLRQIAKSGLAQTLAVAAVALLAQSLIAHHYGLRAGFGKYLLAAEHVTRGELGAERLADFSPLYLSLWVTAERFVADPSLWISWLQRLLAAAAVALLFAVVRRRFTTAWAVGAAVVLTLDRHLLVYQLIFEPEVCLLAFLLGFLFFVERPGLGAALAAGGLAALCLATRPNFLPVFLLVPLVFFLRSRPDGRWQARTVVFCLPWLTMLGLLAWRSAGIEGDLRTPVMNPGTVFFEGNNPLSLGTSAVYPPSVATLLVQTEGVPDSAHVHYRDVARAGTGRPLTIAEVNGWWSQHALAFVRDEPWHWAERLMGKLLFVFHGFRWHDVATARRYDAFLGVPSFPFALLSALALLGLLLTARRWRELLVEYLLAATQIGVMLAFYVSARQQLVLVPVLLIFAVAACRVLVELKARALPYGLVAALLAWALTSPTDEMRDRAHQNACLAATERLSALLQMTAAREPPAWHTETSIERLAAMPWGIDRTRPAFLSQAQGSIEERIRERLAANKTLNPSQTFDLATYELKLGHAAAAAKRLVPLVESPVAFYRGSTASSEPLLYLARARALLNEVEAAVGLLRTAQKRAPGDPYVLAELAVLSGEPGWEEQLVRYWGPIDGDWLLGQAFLTHGHPEEAARRLAATVERLPEMRAARIHLAAALGASGKIREGVVEYFRAMRLGTEPVILETSIVGLFRTWLAQHPDQPEVRFNTARVLYQYGYLNEALALLDGLETTSAEERARLLRAEITRASAKPG